MTRNYQTYPINIHSLDYLRYLQKLFYQDRPVLEAHNPKYCCLLGFFNSGEIEELNGHTSDGMTLEKYREQEIADIAIFALGILRKIGDCLDRQLAQGFCQQRALEFF